MSDREKAVGLKPCPFCGGEAILELSDADDCYIICKSCMCCTNHYEHHSKATESWNNRSTPPQSGRECQHVKPSQTSASHYKCTVCGEVYQPKTELVALEEEKLIELFRTLYFHEWEMGYEYNFVDDLDDLLRDKIPANGLNFSTYGGKELAKLICQRFAHPPVELPSVEEIETIIKGHIKIYDVSSNIRVVIPNTLAKAIHAALERKI